MSTRLAGAKYRQVFDQGRSFRGRLVVVWILRTPNAGRQAGVVVSKKSFHDAADRNRAKRIMREAFRLLAPQLAADSDWVLVGRSTLKGKRTGDVMDELKYIARKCGAAAQA